MKNRTSAPRRRERGAVLLAALALSVIAASLVGAGLYVSSSHHTLAYSQARSESALLLAEGGVNDELALLAESVGIPDPTDPVAAPGETAKFPGENHPVYGRKGSIGATGETFWVCTSANEWWRSGAAPVPWDGVSEAFWITSSAYVKGAWRRTEVQASKQSIFGQYAVYTNGSYGDGSDAVTVAPSATVTINGTAGTNGTVSRGTGCTLSTGHCVNANKDRCGGSQYPTSTMRPGSKTCDRSTPYTYPTTCSVMKKSCGLKDYSDGAAWTWMKNNCDNATGIYTYRSTATGSTLNKTNCTRSTYTGTTCNNRSASSTTSKGCWDYARAKPGTSGRVKTMVFQPGDYYFSEIQLAYDAGTEIVIDPMALASGGTPGQVRFWIYDSNGWFADDDNVSLPVKMTTATGTTEPDPSLFRVYYGKDAKTLTFNRPSGCRDYNGNLVTGDFKFCGGVYSVTKPANDTSIWSFGSKVNMAGSTGSTGGKCVMNGSTMCDRASFQGPCEVNYAKASHPKDPSCGAKVSRGYCDGR